ncbi:MAG: preprotein translocase subunit SecG [Holosporaceae bacterium]
MRLFILLCFLLITVLMIVVILFQKSESSLGFGSGTMGGMMTARGTANLLTRLTAILATLFIVFSLWLAYLARREAEQGNLISQSKEAVPLQEAPLKDTPLKSTPSAPAQ